MKTRKKEYFKKKKELWSRYKDIDYDELEQFLNYCRSFGIQFFHGETFWCIVKGNDAFRCYENKDYVTIPNGLKSLYEGFKFSLDFSKLNW